MSVRNPSAAPKTPATVRTESILFKNNEAVAVFPSPSTNAEDIVASLDIKTYKAVILLMGGAAGVAVSPSFIGAWSQRR